MDCSVDRCTRPALKRGMCNAHYLRWWRHGDPLGGRKATIAGDPLLWLRSMATYNGDDCVRWPFGQTGSERGSVRFEGRARNHNNVLCTLAHGPAPKDKPMACHSCGNDWCSNPKHVYWGTAKNNYDDSVRHGTAYVGVCHEHHAKRQN